MRQTRERDCSHGHAEPPPNAAQSHRMERAPATKGAPEDISAQAELSRARASAQLWH